MAGRQFWPIDMTFREAVKPFEVFEERFFGHQQVRNLYLLSLVVRHKGAVATTDGEWRRWQVRNTRTI